MFHVEHFSILPATFTGHLSRARAPAPHGMDGIAAGHARVGGSICLAMDGSASDFPPTEPPLARNS